MLVIPLTGNMSWKNLPIMTILFILVNCFVYFTFQTADNQKYYQAIEFYMKSGLFKIESANYLKYLEKTSQTAKFKKMSRLDINKPDQSFIIYREIQGDSAFIEELDQGKIITNADPQYEEWHKLKHAFNEKLAAVVFWRYGYTPAKSRLITFFTYMFLHGGVMHLVGNMVFLWLVGCMIEMGAGRLVLAAGYVITGLLSVSFFGLIYHNSTVPLVGASGAIAGLMGIYTVLYGKRKVDIFYSLGFYFNRTKIPAIALLPFWVGNEIFQLSFGGAENIAYVAHIGGLLSGSLLGYLQGRYLGGLRDGVLAEKPGNRLAALTENGLKAFAELDLQKARSCMEEALAIEPNNRQTIVHLFNIEKMAPENETFHKAAARALNLLSRDKTARDKTIAIYNEYKRLARPAKLSPHLYAQLSINFAEHGELEEASRILAALLRQCPTLNMLPVGLLALARAYLKKSMSDQGNNCLRLIRKHYPDSSECKTAMALLKNA